jgi:hypothetical protein
MASACDDPSYVRYVGTPHWLSGGYDYRIDPRNLPSGDSTELRLVEGHQSWDNSHNDCGLADTSPFYSAFVGIDYRSADQRDGVNMVDFANDPTPLGCPAGSIACTHFYYYADSHEMVEADMRFDTSGADWYSGTGGYLACTASGIGRYNVRSVATHESGHALGLDHVSGSPDLTMYPTASPCDAAPYTLGYGDVLGLRALYP